MENGNVGGLVVLDGPDACGKTTLAKELLQGDQSGYIHLTYDPAWPDPNRTLWKIQYYSLLRAAVRLSRGLMTVIDRHWMSEQVYAGVYRGGSLLSAESRQWDRVIQRLCGVYVICAPSSNSAVERHARQSAKREEMYQAGPGILKVAEKFYSLWHGDYDSNSDDYSGFITSWGGMRHRADAEYYNLDIHADTLGGICVRVMKRMRDRQLTQYPPAFNFSKGNYLGHPSEAEFLFVGDRINPNKSGRWPFVDYGASSATLANALNELRFDETRAMWTNANAKDEHVDTLLKWFPHLKVVALGAAAARYLSDRGISFSSVYHPAYVRRFARTDEFVDQLRKALCNLQ